MCTVQVRRKFMIFHHKNLVLNELRKHLTSLMFHFIVSLSLQKSLRFSQFSAFQHQKETRKSINFRSFCIYCLMNLIRINFLFILLLSQFLLPDHRHRHSSTSSDSMRNEELTAKKFIWPMTGLNTQFHRRTTNKNYICSKTY